jgi:hypothetical protein
MKNTSVIMGEIMAARNNSGAIVLVMTSCFDPIYEYGDECAISL